MSLNSHIDDYLMYYCGLPIGPQYAVMIKGKWGSGKTWYIHQMMGEMKVHNIKYIYVSLYGVSSFKEIEECFFRQLHPVLSSKPIVMVGKLTKIIAKATLKYDYDNDGRSDGVVSLSAAQLELPKYLTDTQGMVLIFDDLERCGIPISDLLGYVNNFVEHNDYKSILVANEEEILPVSGVKEVEYSRVKEKLIGRTFEVRPDISGALSSFIAEVTNGPALQAFNDNEMEIKSIYSASEYRNLRHVRQSILEMERIICTFSTKAQGKKDLLSQFIRLFLVYSFETKSGRFTADEVTRNTPKIDISNNGNKDVDAFYVLGKKYAGISFYDSLLPRNLWLEIIDSGYLNKEAMNEAFMNSRYFISTTMAEWVLLWHATQLNEVEIEANLNVVKKKYRAREYRDHGTVRHVVAIFLWLSEIGVYNKSKIDIVRSAKKYADFLKKNSLLPLGEAALFGSFGRETNQGLGFYVKDTDEFKEVNEYFKEKSEEMLTESYPIRAEKLFSIMLENEHDFCRLISNPASGNGLCESPILMFIDPNRFSKSFINLPQEMRSAICSAVLARYVNSYYASKLIAEQAWLDKVASIVKRESERTPKTVSRYYLSVSCKAFLEASKSLSVQ